MCDSLTYLSLIFAIVSIGLAFYFYRRQEDSSAGHARSISNGIAAFASTLTTEIKNRERELTLKIKSELTGIHKGVLHDINDIIRNKLGKKDAEGVVELVDHALSAAAKIQQKQIEEQTQIVISEVGRTIIGSRQASTKGRKGGMGTSSPEEIINILDHALSASAKTHQSQLAEQTHVVVDRIGSLFEEAFADLSNNIRRSQATDEVRGDRGSLQNSTNVQRSATHLAKIQKEIFRESEEIRLKVDNLGVDIERIAGLLIEEAKKKQQREFINHTRGKFNEHIEKCRREVEYDVNKALVQAAETRAQDRQTYLSKMVLLVEGATKTMGKYQSEVYERGSDGLLSSLQKTIEKTFKEATNRIGLLRDKVDNLPVLASQITQGRGFGRS